MILLRYATVPSMYLTYYLFQLWGWDACTTEPRQVRSTILRWLLGCKSLVVHDLQSVISMQFMIQAHGVRVSYVCRLHLHEFA